MLTSYHVHSTFSDGESSIHDMAQAAVQAGVNELGMSDHFVLLPGNKTVNWSMPLDALPQYFDAIEAARESVARKIIVRCGLEADFVPEAAGELKEILCEHAFDYVIGSVHFVSSFPIDEHERHWEAISQPQRDDIIRSYWDNVAKMAKSGLFDIVGHMDLYKKFGHSASCDISDYILNALDAIAEADMAVELNTSGWHKPVQEAYPSAMILRGCYRRGIPVLITADAHTPTDITRDFARAAQLLCGIGYTQQAVFAKRNRSFTELH
ncbi:MAG: histidinol-phosphatase HisJ family protein [Armatimonadota bacterium]|nr:histidinol-phosphatase HisJ family protein [bacterium]